MRLLIHDLDEAFGLSAGGRFDRVIRADGRYAPCRGCFHCWTKTPAACEMKDSLQEICREIGLADDLVIVTENWYGAYSPAVKNMLDRSIGTSTPMSTYRGGEMHHTLRYGRHGTWSVVVYGDVTAGEKAAWQLTAEKNAVNDGFRSFKVTFVPDAGALEVTAL